MSNSQKAKSNVHVARPGPGYAEGLPAGSPPPVRSSDPNVQNTPSPGGPKYEGNVGDNPVQHFNTSQSDVDRRR